MFSVWYRFLSIDYLFASRRLLGFAQLITACTVLPHRWLVIFFVSMVHGLRVSFDRFYYRSRSTNVLATSWCYLCIVHVLRVAWLINAIRWFSVIVADLSIRLFPPKSLVQVLAFYSIADYWRSFGVPSGWSMWLPRMRVVLCVCRRSLEWNGIVLVRWILVLVLFIYYVCLDLRFLHLVESREVI